MTEPAEMSFNVDGWTIGVTSTFQFGIDAPAQNPGPSLSLNGPDGPIPVGTNFSGVEDMRAWLSSHMGDALAERVMSTLAERGFLPTE